jgi:hypothetical protein
MLLAAAIVPVAAAQTTPVPQMPPMVVHQVVGPTGAQGIKFGLVMPPTGAVPLPRLAIQLTSDYTTTLTPGPGVPADPLYYAGACPWLVAAGWACASLDLPSHGANVLPGEPLGIAGWRWRIDRGIDFIGNSSGNIDLMVDFLARNKLVNGTALAVMGVSRGVGALHATHACRRLLPVASTATFNPCCRGHGGCAVQCDGALMLPAARCVRAQGFLAAHYASHVFGTDKVAAVGLLSPVTNLSLLAEFEAENATIEAALQVRGRFHILCGRFDWDLPICCVF